MEKVEYECPQCKTILRGSPAKAGTRQTCPECGHTADKWPEPIEAEADERPRRTQRPPGHLDPIEIPTGLLIACISTFAAGAVVIFVPFVWGCAAPLAAFAGSASLIVAIRYKRPVMGLFVMLSFFLLFAALIKAEDANQELRNLAREFGGK